MDSAAETIDVYALLLTVAQLAIAFAGFGAVATSLRKSAQHAQVNAGRVVNMLVTSLVVALLALTPCALRLFEVPGAWIWRGTSAFALLLFLAALWNFAISHKEMVARAGIHPVTLHINYGLMVFANLAFGLCAFTAPIANPSALFFAGLFALLVVCGTLFFRVIYSLLVSVIPD